MKVPLELEEIWELASETAHPAASELLPEDWFWDVTNDHWPIGNDDGWDVADQYLRAHTGPEAIDAIEFLEQYLEDMGLSLSAPGQETDGLHQQRIAVAVASCANKIVIGLAYSMFIAHGYIDTRLKELSLQMVQRELASEVLADWCDSEKRAKSLSITAERLSMMPSNTGNNQNGN